MIKNDQAGNALPAVTVMVLNYNGRPYLDACLSSLGAIDYPGGKYEILLVDNGSTDGSADFVSEKFPDVRILKLDKNYGFSKGNNIGTGDARCEYVTFLNNDTVVDKHWLKELAVAITEEDGLIVDSKVVYFHDKDILNIGRGFLNRWGVGFCKGAGEPHSLFNEPVYIHHATGCSMMIKKDDFIKIGGFDEDFFSYHEDIDFGWRAWICGYRIKYIPSSVVYHKSGGTAGGFSPYKTYLITRNTLSYIVKNCGSGHVFSMIFMNIIFDMAVAVYFLFPLKPIDLKYGESVRISAAIFKGISDFLHILPLNFKKRKSIQTRRVVSDTCLLKRGVIMPFAPSMAYLATNNFKTVKCLIESEKAA